MSSVPISIQQLIETTIKEELATTLNTMQSQVSQIQSHVDHSLESLEQVSNRIQDQRTAAQLALDSLSTAIKTQQIASPDLLRPVMAHQLMGNPAHYHASCYYEAMLRFWNANNLVYVLSTQVNFTTHAIALEINRATVEATNAAYDAKNSWYDFISKIDESVVIDSDMLADKWNDNFFAFTIVFTDGLTISSTLAPTARIPVGGLPAGTFVYINGVSFEIANNGYYLINGDALNFNRITSLLNDG